jgi:hypothetical protein
MKQLREGEAKREAETNPVAKREGEAKRFRNA